MRNLTTSFALGLLISFAGLGCERSDPTPPTNLEAAPATPPKKTGPLQAIVRTGKGDFTIEFRPDAAPLSCASFVNLIQRGFYDGQRFHRHSRVIRQAGNPWGDDQRRWNAGYVLLPEFSPELRFDRGGMVALVRQADDVRAPVVPNEFFVTTKQQSERFTFVYPIFAVVAGGQEVVNALELDDAIIGIDLVGDPTPILAPHTDLIEAWNRALDAAPPIDPVGR